jgi:two-component system sensor kinase FixL
MQPRDPSNAKRDPDQIAIQVRDSGVGIDSSRLHQIFPPFVTSKLEETRVGLSISRSIVEPHEPLSAVPNEGPGAGFRFSLPEGGQTLK